ncbi:MAG: GlsB/YeaQ/YmgE family stress response membrane protein [Anaerolineae bacterium]
MNLIVVIIVGAIIGWVASKIMRTQGGLLVDIVVGIVGALLASFLFGRATLTSGSFAVVSLLWSLLGAIIVLAIYRLLFRGRRVSA